MPDLQNQNQTTQIKTMQKLLPGLQNANILSPIYLTLQLHSLNVLQFLKHWWKRCNCKNICLTFLRPIEPKEILFVSTLGAL